MSASNESRTADTYLTHAGCSKVKSVPTTVIVAFITEADAAPEPADEDEQQTLQQVQNKKRKLSLQWLMFTSVRTSRMPSLRPSFFLEASDCVAMHSCEHPALKRFCKMIGIPPLNRKVWSVTHPMPIVEIPSFHCAAKSCRVQFRAAMCLRTSSRSGVQYGDQRLPWARSTQH